MTYAKKKSKASKDLYVRRSNLSILNSPELRKLNRLKYLTIKYNYEKKKIEQSVIYKAFGGLNKIIMFDSYISYKDSLGVIFKPYLNIYIPTLLIDYLRFAHKDFMISSLDELDIKNIVSIADNIYKLFETHNKEYRDADYMELKEKYNLSEKSTYKERAKALHQYTQARGVEPGFYFWLAVMYDVYPFVNYLGKSTDTVGGKDAGRIFFIYPDRNDPLDRRD